MTFWVLPSFLLFPNTLLANTQTTRQQVTVVDLHTWLNNKVAREHRHFTQERATSLASLHDALPSFFSITALVPRDVVTHDSELLKQVQEPCSYADEKMYTNLPDLRSHLPPHSQRRPVHGVDT